MPQEKFWVTPKKRFPYSQYNTNAKKQILPTAYLDDTGKLGVKSIQLIHRRHTTYEKPFQKQKGYTSITFAPWKQKNNQTISGIHIRTPYYWKVPNVMGKDQFNHRVTLFQVVSLFDNPSRKCLLRCYAANASAGTSSCCIAGVGTTPFDATACACAALASSSSFWWRWMTSIACVSMLCPKAT